jgi:hypothetical protein
MRPTTPAVHLGYLWSTRGFPHRGWKCIRVVDLNPDKRPANEVAYMRCQACGQDPIRFVHMLVHDDWPEPVEVGRSCAARLTGDYVNSRRRESELRNRSKRRVAARRRWMGLPWRTSAHGNLWTKVKGHHVVIFRSRFSEGYSYGIDGQFHCGTFPTPRHAQLASCDRFLEREGLTGSDALEKPLLPDRSFGR